MLPRIAIPGSTNGPLAPSHRGFAHPLAIGRQHSGEASMRLVRVATSRDAARPVPKVCAPVGELTLILALAADSGVRAPFMSSGICVSATSKCAPSGLVVDATCRACQRRRRCRSPRPARRPAVLPAARGHVNQANRLIPWCVLLAARHSYVFLTPYGEPVPFAPRGLSRRLRRELTRSEKLWPWRQPAVATLLPSPSSASCDVSPFVSCASSRDRSICI
jgi:hypothetical protein